MDDDIVAIDLKRSDYITVTPSARTLWLLLAAGTTEEAMADSLMSEHGIDRERAARDVAAFVGDLRQRGLVKDG